MGKQSAHIGFGILKLSNRSHFLSLNFTARAQSGANNHKVFRSLGCLISHANKMGKTAEQVHNLDLNLQLVSALSSDMFEF